MAIHIATPAEIDGAIGDDELRAYNPVTGTFLVYRLDDPSFQDALGRGALQPEINTPWVYPASVPRTAGTVNVTIYGAAFTPGVTDVTAVGTPVSSVTVAPRSISFDLTVPTTPGPVTLNVTNPALTPSLRVI